MKYFSKMYFTYLIYLYKVVCMKVPIELLEFHKIIPDCKNCKNFNIFVDDIGTNNIKPVIFNVIQRSY